MKKFLRFVNYNHMQMNNQRLQLVFWNIGVPQVFFRS